MESVELLRLLDEIKILHTKIDSLQKQPVNDPYESEHTNELAAAFAKAQGEYKRLGYNRENPFFKSAYADLDAIIDSVSAALAKNNLSFYQYTEINERGEKILHSKLKHASGQWIESRTRIVPLKNDPQTEGSTLSYQKRYQAACLLRVTPSHDMTDDDGEIAVAPVREEFAKGTGLNTKYNPREQSIETITKEQREELEYELAEYPDICEMVLDGLKIQSIADMPKSKYMASVTRIREIKNLRNGKK